MEKVKTNSAKKNGQAPAADRLPIEASTSAEPLTKADLQTLRTSVKAGSWWNGGCGCIGY